MTSRSNIPHKGDIVINPKTSRPIKVGGSVWRKLVKEGLLSGHYQDPKILGTYSSDNDWKIKQKILKQQLPEEYVPSRGKGKYKNKIVKRVNPYESVKSKASRGAKSLADQYDFNEDELRKMLMESMSVSTKKKKPTYRTCSRLVSSDDEGGLADSSDDDDDDDEDDEDETDEESDF